MTLPAELELELNELHTQCMQEFEIKKNDLLSKYVKQNKTTLLAEQIEKERKEQSFIDEVNNCVIQHEKSISDAKNSIEYHKRQIKYQEEIIERNIHLIENPKSLPTPSERLHEILSAKIFNGDYVYQAICGELYRTTGYDLIRVHKYIAPRNNNNKIIDYFCALKVIEHIEKYRD